MKVIYYLLYIIFLTKCSSEKRDDKSQIITWNNEEINNELNFIQSKIDSGVVVYQLAINDIKQGVKEEKVIAKYETKAAHLHQSAAKAIEEMTHNFMNKNKTQEDYDKFITKLNTDEIEKKSQELDSLGIKFNLKK